MFNVYVCGCVYRHVGNVNNGWKMCRCRFQRTEQNYWKKTVNILLKWIYLPNLKLNLFFIESVYLYEKQYRYYIEYYAKNQVFEN